MKADLDTVTAPLISVLTVVRNGASCVEKTVKSVISQTYSPLEYIVVDGASSDGTQDILRDYQSSISKWISEPDDGIADGFNKAILMASGDAVLFMNAGDEFEGPDSLTALVKAVPMGVDIRECIAYGNANIVSPDGIRRQLTDHRLLGSSNETPICHQSVLIGTSLQKRFLFDRRLRIMMDLDLWLRCAAAKAPFYKAEAPISRYLAGGTSDSRESMVPAVVEGGLIRILNNATDRSVATVGTLFLDVLRANIKQKLRGILGERRYLALKRASRSFVVRRR